MLVTGTPLTSWWVTVVAPPDPADETAKVDSFPLSGGTGGARDEDEGGKGCMAKAGPPENSKQVKERSVISPPQNKGMCI